MKKLLKLILVEVAEKPKVIHDPKDGPINKWRHVFMTPEGQELIGFSDNDGYRARVTPALAWDESKASEFLFNSTMWEGKEQLRLVERVQADTFIREMNKKK